MHIDLQAEGLSKNFKSLNKLVLIPQERNEIILTSLRTFF